jgi:glycosyltransferase involved in cell wall biosynthesis
MKVLYISTVCSNKVFKEIFNNSLVKPTSHQVQKFHNLLVKGLSKSVENIHILSKPPVNKSTNRKTRNSLGEEKVDNITYQYIKFITKPILKDITVFISGFINTIRWIRKNRKEEMVIVCDVLNLSLSISAFLASKLCGVKSVGIVLDIPNYIQSYTRQKRSLIERLYVSLYKHITNFAMLRYDYYVILTQQMNELVNPLNKPYVVIEGVVDLKMQSINNLLQEKYDKKVIIYAGALREKYGVKKLIESFMEVKLDDARLWLYGSGELEQEIREYEKKDARIRYYGVALNEEIIKQQLKATLLVNPRPSDEDFTKYSFPSKNMEYMASGTPILTTPLQGMPKEYNDYIFLYKEETIKGMAKELEDVLGKCKKELHEKGMHAKHFVLQEKNNVVQARKIIELLKNR